MSPIPQPTTVDAHPLLGGRKIQNKKQLKDQVFDFEGYQVVMLKDIQNNLSEQEYRAFIGFLEGQTIIIDKDGNTLIFYRDINRFLILTKNNPLLRKKASTPLLN